MRRFYPTALSACLLATLALAACDSADSEFEIGGTYSGVTEDLRDEDTGEGTFTTLTVDIPDTESGESFRFEGSVIEQGGFDEVIDPVTGTGTYDHPALTLVVDGEALTGTVSDDGDTIAIETDPGDAPATLRRQ
ncbi:hypothetical protein RQM47_02730 [Rubrivirga sp. S365]|uniref:Uncharacterized protein n=1 Tax=Rubrivirga litoralis TaxID=3075598 RepID=A0ABU3BR06_9BACT|nr:MULTISPECIES: hypothetical protein [unclassified Rubrivirga]MDT0631704.1 hypothetical protein [Rubrivirga sp. F394]MDT7855552.1 hypothetical protein [Rubrivirga sp. S365]